MARDAVDRHYRKVIREIAEGGVIPLLGAGVNRCGRPENATWQRDDPRFLPSGGELASFLADYFDYPPDDTRDLLRISQYGKVIDGDGTLYRELREIFAPEREPTALHRFLAGLPSVLKDKRCRSPYQLILTTNYDDSLERAFREASEPFDLVTYIADGEHQGKFLHRPPAEPPRLIEPPNTYGGLSPDQRTVILKIHGDVDRDDATGDSYVITEDHYIDYLTRTDIAEMLPVTLLTKLRGSSFLFLGYSLRDWNLRVILHRIWGRQTLSHKSWAIQLRPGEIDCELWRQRNVDILDVALDEYVAGLEAQLKEPFGAGVVP